MTRARKIFFKLASANSPGIVTPAAIVGTPAVGFQTTYTPALARGTLPLTVTQQWTLDGADISGATAATYTPLLADAEHTLRVRETITNAYGSVVSLSAGVVIPSGVQSYVGGDTLYVNLPTGLVGTIYVQRDGVDIPGAVSAPSVGSYTYTTAAIDDGHALTPRVTDLSYTTAAPRRFSTIIAIAEPAVVAITYDENLDDTSVPATSAFTTDQTNVATAKTLSSVAIVGNVVKLTYDSNFVPGDQPLISYTVPGSNPLRDLAHVGILAPAFSGVYAANQFPVPATAVVLPVTTTYAVGGGGFVNNGVSGNFTYGFEPRLTAFGDHNIRLDEEGWVEMQCSDTNAATRAIGLFSSGASGLNSMPQAARLVSGAVRAFINSVGQGTAYTFPAPSALCRVRLYRTMPVGVITMDTSEDGGTSWATRFTFANQDGTQLKACVCDNSSSVPVLGAAVQNFIDLGY